MIYIVFEPPPVKVFALSVFAGDSPPPQPVNNAPIRHTDAIIAQNFFNLLIKSLS